MALLLLLAALVLLPQSAPAATAEDPLYNFCEGGNYTADSSFHSNLRSLLASLSASNSSFSTDVKGTDSDKAYGLVMCRGDVGSDDCKACVKAASASVPKLCARSKRAVVWYDYCELRYSDVRFFSSIDGPLAILYNIYNSTDPETFTPAAKELTGKVADRAARKSSSSSLLFATGITKHRRGDVVPTIYGLAQCTGDLSADVCGQCLGGILDYYWNSIYAPKRGGRVLGYSCNFRYEVYTFFAGDPTISLDATNLPSPSLSPAVILSPPPIAPTRNRVKVVKGNTNWGPGRNKVD